MLEVKHDAPLNTVFVGRRPSGDIYTPALGRIHPGRDWILTRILWLSGLEPGRNRLGDVDTMQRYIYIHGTPDEVTLGVPGSHGCIRMRNRDGVELFDRVPAGTHVRILEQNTFARPSASLKAAVRGEAPSSDRRASTPRAQSVAPPR